MAAALKPEMPGAAASALQPGRVGLHARFPISAYLLAALLLLTALALRFVLSGRAFAFADIGADTFFQFFPMQVADSRQLHVMHTITWSFNLGLGGYLGSLFDPLMLATGWLPESWQLASRLPMFAFRVIAAGAFFYGYLRLIRFDPRIAILGALGYAFSSYGMLNAQWEVMHGTEFVQFAAFLFLFEKYLGTRSRWAPVGAGIVIGLGHPMGLYMFGLFGLIYALARLTVVAAGEWSKYASGVCAFAAWCVPGLLLAAPLLFPALYYLFESPRVSGNYSQLHALLAHIFQINDRATISSEIAGLFGKDLLGSNLHYSGWGNYFEGPGFYIGLLPLLCIPQLVGPQASRTERRILAIGTAGIALYFAFPALRTAVYGFGEPTFRFSTLWISALLLVQGLAGLRRVLISGIWRPGIAFALALVLGVPLVGTLLIPGKIDYGQLLRIAGFGCAYAVILWQMTLGDASRARTVSLLIPVVACELLLFAAPAVVQREATALDASSPIGRYHDGTEQALDYVRQYQRHFSGNDDFYRIDKTYYSVFLDDALVQDYPGTASYFFHASSVTRFVDRMNLDRITPSPNYISSMSDRRNVIDLLGVRYLLSLDHKPAAERDLIFVTAVGNVNIYRNATAHAFGTFFSSIVPEASVDSLPAPQKDAILLDHIVLENSSTAAAGLAALRLGPTFPGLKQLADIRKIRDDELVGNVKTPDASLLLLSMPFDRGWSAVLDDKPLELFRADYGLTAALIPAGTHTLALVYEPPGRHAGIALSLVSLVLLSVLWRHDRARLVPLRRMLYGKV